MGELFSIFNRDLVKKEPGSRYQEDKRLYWSGKEALGKLGNIQFSGRAQRGCGLPWSKEPHTSVLSKLLAWPLLWERTFPEMPRQEEPG